MGYVEKFGELHQFFGGYAEIMENVKTVKTGS